MGRWLACRWHWRRLEMEQSGLREPVGIERSVFIPTREVISIYPGFIAAWQERESSFDRTYFDLCVALNRAPLRGHRQPIVSDLMEPLQEALGGRVVVEAGRFYVESPDGKMEAPLVAEGIRKLATIAYLLVNGSLVANGFLFWDEPEANMNPNLVVLTKRLLLGFAEAGIQVFVATHDFLLARELSLAAEYGTGTSELRFIALARSAETGAIEAEDGATLADLQDNPILDEFAAHYDREAALFSAGASGDPR